MKLKDFDRVRDLRDQLAHAEAVLEEFRKAPGPTVPATAYARDGSYARGASVALLPVAKEVAVSAAERARSKILAELQQLGVEA